MNAHPQPRREAGLSIIELMVALAIGSLLILALVEVFAASRSAYMLSSGLARTQENGRFAIDILQRDLRMAGHAGCVNDQARFLPANVTASRPALISTFLTDAQLFASPVAYDAVEDALRFDVSITGYEAVGTASGGSFTVSATPQATDQTGWTDMPPELFDQFPEPNDPGEPVAGSDVLVLRFFSPTGVQVTNFIPGDPARIEFDADQAERLTEGLANPGLFAIADCMQAAVFQATTAPLTTGTITVGTSGLNASSFVTTPPFTTGQAMLYRAESVVYYIGRNANDNPALYRMRYTAAPGAGAVTAMLPEELVEGIESLQLEFGQDSNTGATQIPTGNIGSSVVASGVEPAGDPETAWRRVGLVRVGLLARSTEPAAAEQRNANAAPLSALGVAFVPPNDTRYRAVYEDTIALRNRLFGN
ncbi:PilW family protein [Luteimonas saliphila]|uniref:PilW family protein n=1 Tax=Luteimonas saliphila TaxID=2804919 RepID=UPI00192DB3CE|nr:PilW family protein [Luteimonas saliphila]